MNFIVFGCGSIGCRHIKTLLDIGHDVVAYNRSSARCTLVKETYGISVFTDIESLFAQEKANAALICTPNSSHIDYAIEAAKRGLHIFIEKPLSNNFNRIDELSYEVKRNSLIVHIGSNLRFHFGPEKIYHAIESNTIGRPLWASFYGGMYLPNWHPNEDYREMYSAKTELGGGATLDFIHEIDIILWMFGKPELVTAIINQSGWLEIETEDIVDAVLKYSNRFQVNVHLDYLQKPFQRGIRIVGDRGWIQWDIQRKSVETYLYDSTDSIITPYPIGWTHQSMYNNQMKYFISCLEKEEESMSNLNAGINALELALNIKKSSNQRVFIRRNK